MTTKLYRKYYPSSADRWMRCTASENLIASLVKQGKITIAPPGPSAQEGTRLHTLAEVILLGNEKLEDCGEKDRSRIETYVQWVEEKELPIAAQGQRLHGPRSALEVSVQKRVSPSVELKGKLDYVAVTNDELIIADLKTGWGEVSPDTYQLRIYAWMLMPENFTKPVKLVIVQGKKIKGIIVTPEEVRSFGEELKLTIKKKKVFSPSSSTCKWCPARNKCPAFFSFATDLVRSKKTDYEEILKKSSIADLADEVLAQISRDISILNSWDAEIRREALDRIELHDKVIPGFTYSGTRSRLTWVDTQEAIDWAEKSGYGEEIVTVEVKKTICPPSKVPEEIASTDEFKTMIQNKKSKASVSLSS